LDTLLRANLINSKVDGKGNPSDWAFIAMAHHKLGQVNEAMRAFTKLKELMKVPAYASSPDYISFLNEAEVLISSSSKNWKVGRIYAVEIYE